MDRVGKGGVAASVYQPAVSPQPSNPLAGASNQPGVPAAFRDVGTGGGSGTVPRIPGTDLPQPPPPLVPSAPASVPATLGTSTMERDAPAGFKRLRLATGHYLTVPESWAPEEPTI